MVRLFFQQNLRHQIPISINHAFIFLKRSQPDKPIVLLVFKYFLYNIYEISIWFSNKQFKMVFDNKKQHTHMFSLLITLKDYYTKIHPESEYNSLTLRHFVQHNPDNDKHLSKRQIYNLMQEMNFPKQQFEQYLSEVPEYAQNGKLSMHGFMQLIQVMQCPQDLYQIFQKYAKSSLKSGTLYEKYSEHCMSNDEFKMFLKEVQSQQKDEASKSIQFNGNSNSPPNIKDQNQQNPPSQLSFIDFCRHILSNSKNPSIYPQTIDLSKPLPHYYVNSSHNTYLVGNQLTSMSSANVYYLNLIEGMRCVQLDIHDGKDGPIIKHGFALTAPIQFEAAMKAIMKYCIENPTHTPIILSFQNHCTEQNRKRMANILRIIPNQKFYVIPPNSDNQCEYPPLKQLTGKIIIQGTGSFQQMFPSIIKLQRKNKMNKKQNQITALIYSQAIQESMLFNLNQRKLPQNLQKLSKKFSEKIQTLEQRKIQTKKTLKNAQLELINRNGGSSQELNRYYGLVAATFDHNNSCWEMANIAENNLITIIKGLMPHTAQDVYRYSWNGMIRIYPFGLRFDSSNFNPIPMLQCGCQLVSFNTQNVDIYYVCVQGIFQKNRNCGYSLKNDIKNQDNKKYRYRIVFMDCIDIRPRKAEMSDQKTSLQVSFLGSQQDMQTNFKYVNTNQSPSQIQKNEAISISESFFCKNLQVQLVGLQGYQLKEIPSIFKGVSETLYPHVNLQIKNSQFAHLYMNIPHCGSMSIPLKDLRKGLRIVPLYCFQIGRKKTMGSILIWVQINQQK